MNFQVFILLFAFAYVQSRGIGDAARKQCESSRNRGLKNVQIQEDFGHMVLLNNDVNNRNKYICGGVLISPNFVLTTATCVKHPQGDLRYVYIGDPKLKNSTKKGDFDEYKVVDAFIYPAYKADLFYNDIALVKLEKNVEPSDNIYTACLQSTKNIDLTELTSAGWGLTENKELNREIARFTELQNAACEKEFTINGKRDKKLKDGVKQEQMICATRTNGDSCFVESGSPLQIKNPQFKSGHTVIGISSFGKLPCKTATNPLVYMRVWNYMEWIESIVWP